MAPGRRAAISLLAVAVLWSANALAADDTSELEGLLDEPVVETASKTAESADVAPATSVTIGADELERHGIRTVAEAIDYLGAGMWNERRFQVAEAGSRGVLITRDYGAHVLVVLDGHVLNEPWGAASYLDRGLTIPIEMVDHIELMLGPGSVLYGSNAMLGVVHVVTKRAKDFSGAHLVVDSEIPISLRGAAGFGREVRLLGARGDVVMMFEHYEQQGPHLVVDTVDAGPDGVTGVPRLYSPRQPPGIWGGKSLDGYYVHAPAGYMRLRLGGTELGVRVAQYLRTDPSDGGNFDDPASHERDRWINVDLKHTLPIGRLSTLATRLYGDLYDYDQHWTSRGAYDCLEGQDQGCDWRLHGISRSAGIEPILSLDWLKDRRLVTLVGIDARVRRVASVIDFFDNVTLRSPGPTGAYAIDERALAIYLQQTAWPWQRLGLNAGARIDVDERYGSFVLPRVAATMLPWRRASLKLMYSEAFRAPSAYEIYFSDPASTVPGGEQLEPERVRSGEVSFEQRFGAQRVRFAAFRTRWTDLSIVALLSDDEILAAVNRGELEPQITEAYQTRNVSTVDAWGFDAGYDGSLHSGDVRYGLSVTQAFARRDDAQERPDTVATSAPSFGNARLSWDLPAALPVLALAARFIARRTVNIYPEDRRFITANVDLHAAITGPLGLGGVSYRLTAAWSSADDAPYVISPEAADGSPRALVPVDKLRFGAGLRWDFGE